MAWLWLHPYGRCVRNREGSTCPDVRVQRDPPLPAPPRLFLHLSRPLASVPSPCTPSTPTAELLQTQVQKQTAWGSDSLLTVWGRTEHHSRGTGPANARHATLWGTPSSTPFLTPNYGSETAIAATLCCGLTLSITTCLSHFRTATTSEFSRCTGVRAREPEKPERTRDEGQGLRLQACAPPAGQLSPPEQPRAPAPPSVLRTPWEEGSRDHNSEALSKSTACIYTVLRASSHSSGVEIRTPKAERLVSSGLAPEPQV